MRNGNFAGYVGQNARLNAMPSGDLVCSWSLGVSAGTKNPQTLWVDCSMWGARAEKLHTHIIKGSAMAVSGDVGLRQYTGKDGSEKAVITCRVDKLTFLGGKGERAAPRAGGEAGGPGTQATGGGGFIDEDLPFDVYERGMS
jgi:single-strand DNA-binding protein